MIDTRFLEAANDLWIQLSTPSQYINYHRQGKALGLKMKLQQIRTREPINRLMLADSMAMLP